MDIMADGSTLQLSGDMDVRSSAEVRDAISGHLEACPGDVRIDMTDVRSVDLVALRVVAAASRRADRSGRRVVITGAGGQMLRMLHLTRLIRFVQVERTAIGA